MLEARSYYGYYGPSGGYTGDDYGTRSECNHYFDFSWERFFDGKVVEKSFFRIFGDNYEKAFSEAKEIADCYGCILKVDAATIKRH